MNLHSGISALLLSGVFNASLVFAQSGATLAIDFNRTKAPVSPTLYGLMTEEINYSYDGGLYAELVRNRTFRSDWSGILNWFLVEKGTSSAKISVDSKNGPSAALTNSVKLEVTKADAESPAGLLNEGYWGMAVRPNTRFTGSLYAKTSSESLPLTVALVADQSGKTLAQTSVSLTGAGWNEYKFELQSGNITASAENHLELTVQKPATVWLQLVSLFPPTYHGRKNGNRPDLMEKLAAMHPSFLRFPGGNYLEGNRIDTRFDWKKTIGPMVDRPTHPGTWSYHSTDGLGLLEFLQWCEDLKMEPLLAVYAGYSLGPNQAVKAGADLEPYVKEALEEIEYVTGGPETKWGAVRARNGHPEPFPLRYVEVGNEDSFDRAKTYDDRFAQFFKAIKAKYPKLQVIATIPVKGTTPDVVDDHYYKHEQGMFELTKHYDNADRSGPKIFVGEWATREGTPTPNMGGALGDAAFMTSMERNSDLIVMASYAPLLVNVNPGGMQWASDLIGYDAMGSYGSPSYYAQVMFASCLGDHTVDSTVSDGGDKFFYSVTASSKSKKACVKLVNASSAPLSLSLKMTGLGTAGHQARVSTLRGNSIWATNSIDHPDRIVPVNSTLAVKGEHVSHTVPGYSVQVLEFDLK
jgi:alpha-N-arabinofuranosidase